jgi:DNA-directed RNA polymerase specialized sigma24 family protein
LNSSESGHLLGELLARLPKHEREMILDAEEMAQAELARKLHVPIGTLRVWLYRTREKLRKMCDISQYPETE